MNYNNELIELNNNN